MHDTTNNSRPSTHDETAIRQPAGRMLIESLGVYYPPRIVSTSDVLAGCRNKVRVPLELFTGIKRRRMADEGQYSRQLAGSAIRDCLSRSKYSPQDIDVLISCDISKSDGPISQSSVEPASAVRLAHEFGFATALAFDVTNACAGFFTGLLISQAMLATGAARRAMVVSGEHITHLIRTAQLEIKGLRDPRLACLTLGDAGLAAVLELSAQPGVGFHEIDLYTLGRYSSLCVGKLTENAHGGAIMLTDSPRIAEVAIEQFASHAPLLLARHGIRPEACDHFIMHQTARRSLHRAAGALNRSFGRKVLNRNNTICNLADRGNTATTTHLVAVMDHIRSGHIRTGNTAVFGIAASGQTAGAAIYTFDDLPDRVRGEKAAPWQARSAAAHVPRQVPRDQPRVRIESNGVAGDQRREGTNTLALLKSAAQSCLQNSGYLRRDIQLVINTGVYRNDFFSEPAIAAVLAGELQINDASESPTDKKTLAFDITSGATGFLSACYVASQMLVSGKYATAMIVASEIEYNRDVWPEKLLGLEETGTAAILDRAGIGTTGFSHFHFRRYDQHLQRFQSHSALRSGRSALWFARDGDLQDHFLDCIRQSVGELLDEAELRIQDIDVVLPPQISSSFVERLGHHLRVPRDRLVRLLQPRRDLYTSSLVHSFLAASHRRDLKPGSTGLVIEVGAGIQTACALYRW